MNIWQHHAAVGLGSALGASLRYLTSLWLLGSTFPWATLLVNILGSWLIAAFAAYASRRLDGRVARWQPFLLAGFCGGFTTFSLFGLETLYLFDQERYWLAPIYVGISVTLWLAGAWHGDRWGRRLALARR
ncbi:CrcB family protein [Halomonas sp. TRM85114]|uniref:fluoride efflux transporter FluC n=1 Tax=Halomonas jincaotanensis TaxID=2810616 RepID=UPI001BD3BED4|nr:CrcB family protein [Halomonas jincaotanensis]MBS9404691.1 CrcB family protein [Halomonas jincaotanensis]